MDTMRKQFFILFINPLANLVLFIFFTTITSYSRIVQLYNERTEKIS